MSPLVWKFVIFGVVGLAGEVCFTALLDLFRTRRLRLHGFSFVWMFPIYGLLAILFPIIWKFVSSYSWPVRGIVYMSAIYLVEFLSGTILTAFVGTHIWQYTDRLNFRGQITLLYAPVWFLVGLAVEKYYPWVEKASQSLAIL
ncbi:MAG: hypothetical protein HYT76_09380 [Deltaproteobacteria bacterium]|nr:hypothetical protein [Deltaproteobacteria bacterium]